MAQARFDYLIVGNSTAAIGAVEAIRSCDRAGTIGIIASEDEHTYSRPLITYFVAGKVTEDNIYYRPPDFYEKNDVGCLFGREVVSVSTDESSVTLDGGEKVGYGSLLLAAGGAPIGLDIPGADRPGVFFMNTMRDARRAKGWLSHARRAVVVGGGLTGLKTAEALAQIGQEATIVELANRVLAPALDAAASEIVRQVLVQHGVSVLTETQVTSFDAYEDSNDVSTATLNTGESIACDTAFITIGVRPRVDLVKGAGVNTNRGIVVDSHMRTSVANVYAAGDIAEAFDPLVGGQRVLPILPNAYIGGRVAGLNMIGRDAIYNVGMSVNSVSFFGHPIMSAGFATQEEGDGFRVFSRLDGLTYRKFVVRDGVLVGMILSGEVDRAGLMTGMMRSGVPVDGLEDKLLSGDLGLIDLPSDVVEERIHGRGRNWL